MVKLNMNHQGRILNDSEGDNNLPLDTIDPTYKMFLEHLRKDGRSYILEMEDGDNGSPVFVKYETVDGLFGHCGLVAQVSSDHRSFSRKGIFVTKRRNRKSDSGNRRFNSHIDESIGLSDSLKNKDSVGLSDSLNNKDEINLADDSYQEFLSYLKLQDGLMVLEYKSVSVIYEGNETSTATKSTSSGSQGPLPSESTLLPASQKPATQNACSDNQELVLYESTQIPDLTIYGDHNKSIVPLDSCNLYSFDLKLRVVLNKPYDQHEHQVLWEEANFHKPIQRHKDLRNQCVSFSTMQMGLSYLDHFPDLARKLEHADPQQALTLLRGLFFWLKNLCHEGAYQPWASASSKIVEVSDHDMVLPLVEQKMETENSSSQIFL